VVADGEDFETEMEIADAFRELMSIFRNLRFDYMVIPKSDIPLDEIIPKDSVVVYSKT
jgi:hypothetical protein